VVGDSDDAKLLLVVTLIEGEAIALKLSCGGGALTPTSARFVQN